jgi:hypothetical protein
MQTASTEKKMSPNPFLRHNHRQKAKIPQITTPIKGKNPRE